MSVAEFVTIVVAITPLVVGIAAVYLQVKSLQRRVDGRLTQLLELTRQSSHAEGLLEGTPQPDPHRR